MLSLYVVASTLLLFYGEMLPKLFWMNVDDKFAVQLNCFGELMVWCVSVSSVLYIRVLRGM
jgi:hypothetical protein